VLARTLGLTPEEPTRTVIPLTAEVPLDWTTGGVVIPAGNLIGFLETVQVETEEGVTLTGDLRTALLLSDMVASDRVTLIGDPVLTLEHAPFPGERITDVIPVARI